MSSSFTFLILCSGTKTQSSGTPNVVTNTVKTAVPTLLEGETLKRASLLANNKELAMLYDQLVKAGTITDEEFWDSRKVWVAYSSYLSLLSGNVTK